MNGEERTGESLNTSTERSCLRKQLTPQAGSRQKVGSRIPQQRGHVKGSRELRHGSYAPAGPYWTTLLTPAPSTASRSA